MPKDLESLAAGSIAFIALCTISMYSSNGKSEDYYQISTPKSIAAIKPYKSSAMVHTTKDHYLRNLNFNNEETQLSNNGMRANASHEALTLKLLMDDKRYSVRAQNLLYGDWRTGKHEIKIECKTVTMESPISSYSTILATAFNLKKTDTTNGTSLNKGVLVSVIWRFDKVKPYSMGYHIESTDEFECGQDGTSVIRSYDSFLRHSFLKKAE
jgi:hypothetical protein